MDTHIGWNNLWLYYVLAYVLAMSIQGWAERKRGEPVDDPDFLYRGKVIFPLAILWILSGLVISLFIPIVPGGLFVIGLCFILLGMAVTVLTFLSFARQAGLVRSGIHRYSRNPGYVGWVLVLFGLLLAGWSASPWSILFLVYFLLSLAYLHWTVLLEERFMVNKFGDPYKQYLQDTARYIGAPRR